MHDYDKLSRSFSWILFIRNHMLFLVQFGINKHLKIVSKTTNCTHPIGSFNFVSLWKNLLGHIRSKLRSKSFDYVYLYTSFTCNTDSTWIMRINWKATIIELLTLILIYTHNLLTNIHCHKWLNTWKSFMWTAVKEISMEATFAVLNTTQAVVKLRPVKKSENLH